MHADVWHIVIPALAVVISACALYLGIPAWRLARSQVATQRHAAEAAKSAKEQAEFQRRVLQALAGNNPDAGTSAESPSLLDVMRETRDALHTVNRLQVIVAHHAADGHGVPIPSDLWPE